MELVLEHDEIEVLLREALVARGIAFPPRATSVSDETIREAPFVRSS